MADQLRRRQSFRAACSCVIAGCQSTTAPLVGSGYQMVRFSDAKAAVAASQDPTAGPAVASNDVQCVMCLITFISLWEAMLLLSLRRYQVEWREAHQELS